ncbi:MAG: putative RNA uridine N3 methyltransferase, partial [Candidatus Caldarchaeum sp.]|nr:putative RNA uridine N3 methyltransferase [Candidatus Caldarchaeum sp.]
AGGRTCVAFGAFDRGLKQIAEELQLDYSKLFDITVNTAPRQAVKTIRTEEALAYTLAILNLISP